MGVLNDRRVFCFELERISFRRCRTSQLQILTFSSLETSYSFDLHCLESVPYNGLLQLSFLHNYIVNKH